MTYRAGDGAFNRKLGNPGQAGEMLALTALLMKTPAPRPCWGLPRPNGRVALTISGSISWPNQDGHLALDAELLREFDSRTIETTTDWSWQDGPQSFRGIAVLDLLLAAGRRGDRLVLESDNGYRAEASMEELRAGAAIVATELNGMPLPCTRFGPLWLVFPFDSAPSALERWHQTRRSVWGLTRIEVV